MQANYVQRIRLQFSKEGTTIYIGHLDLARTLERSVNRADIPIAYTQGFNKRPRMQLADALPLGFSSECELVDLWLAEEMDPDEVQRRLEPVLPKGIALHSVRDISLSQEPLQTQTKEAVYEVFIDRMFLPLELRTWIDGVMNETTIIRERRGKEYDLRPRIVSMEEIEGGEKEAVIRMRLTMTSGAVGRPDEVLMEMGMDPDEVRIHRTQIVLESK